MFSINEKNNLLAVAACSQTGQSQQGKSGCGGFGDDQPGNFRIRQSFVPECNIIKIYRLSFAQCGTTLPSATELNPILECIQNGASVGAIMGIFLWREVKRAERYENLYNEESRLRHEAESKCASCSFVKKANAEFIEKRTEEEK